jgi:hypothetical protein
MKKMKKLFFTLTILMSFAFTNVSNDRSKVVLSETDINNKNFCTISCSRTVDGVTYTSSAGNWFSTCRGAWVRCREKLSKATLEMQ